MSTIRYSIGELRCWLHRRQSCKLLPMQQCDSVGDSWVCTGNDPAFHVDPASGLLPRGWYILEILAVADTEAFPAKL